MELSNEAVQLRIHIGENDRWHHEPLYEALVLKAREFGLAGATVIRSPMGFGASCQVHTAKIISLSTDLPVIVEIVDTEEKLTPFLAVLDEMLDGGLVTMQKVKVVHCRPKKEAPKK